VALIQQHRFQLRTDTDFAPYGLDEPYRVFISEDPIGFEGGINLYSYASNNPLLLIDPLGLFDYQQLLQNTADYAGVAAAATFLTPGGQFASGVFTGIYVGAKGLEISLYSKHPVIDTAGEIVKMRLPVGKPYDMFTDQAVDLTAGKINSMIDSYSYNPSHYNQNNPAYGNPQSTMGCHASK
jgi:uncharacterized protein RhaS with RHS repeats